MGGMRRVPSVSDLKFLFESVMMFFHYEFEIYGYKITFFKLFLLTILVGFVGQALGNIFGGD